MADNNTSILDFEGLGHYTDKIKKYIMDTSPWQKSEGTPFSGAQMANDCTAFGASVAEGLGTVAGINILSIAHAEGSQTKAIGQYSHSEGFQTQAIGNCSHSSGDNTICYNYGEFAAGQFNCSNQSSDNDQTLFSIGNGGSESSRHNAFEVDKNGNVKIPNTLDYALNNISHEYLPVVNLQEMMLMPIIVPEDKLKLVHDNNKIGIQTAFDTGPVYGQKEVTILQKLGIGISQITGSLGDILEDSTDPAFLNTIMRPVYLSLHTSGNLTGCSYYVPFKLTAQVFNPESVITPMLVYKSPQIILFDKEAARFKTYEILFIITNCLDGMASIGLEVKLNPIESV